MNSLPLAVNLMCLIWDSGGKLEELGDTHEDEKGRTCTLWNNVIH